MALPNTLQAILLKVRRITKMPNSNQITDAQITEYINTYYLYDFPQELRLKNCLSNYTFTTIPYQESYRVPTDTIITIEPPVYINGYQSFFTQSQDNFYRLYPKLSLQYDAQSGTNITGPYNVQITPPPGVPMQGMFQNNVVVSVVNSTTGVASAIGTDSPTSTASGSITGFGVAAGSTVNYLTGALVLNFSNAIAPTEQIVIQYVPYAPSRPVAMLFYNDIVYLRPVPDQAYLVSIQAYVNPLVALTGASKNPPINADYEPYTGGTSIRERQQPMPPNLNPIQTGFDALTDTAQLKQWWQLLAWGAAMKIFEDRGDFDQMAQFMPLYENQKRLVLRRTLVEMSNERVASIYSEQTGSASYGNFYGQF